jgi:hypothetical protein
MGESLLSLCLDDLPPAVKTVWTDMVAQMNLAASGLYRQRRIAQRIVRAVHASFRWGLLILLNCHNRLLNII